jgi:hypothetical protein
MRLPDGNPDAFAALLSAEPRTEIMMRACHVIRIQPPVPLGEVTMVPAALYGRGVSETARAMEAALSEIAEMPSAADFLARLRGTFGWTPWSSRADAVRRD